MKPIEIKKGIYWIGGLDPTLEIFDIVMETEFGTTYNSYLIKGDKVAVVETVKEQFFGDFLEKIQSLTDPKKIDYIILNHTEPDHAGSIHLLLEVAPQAQIVCSRPASMYVHEMLNRDFNHMIVKDGDTLDLGQGKVCHFISAPMLHWPDSQYTYIPSDKVIFTCDSFGCHYSEGEAIFDDQITDLEGMRRAQKYYYDVIMGPFSSYMLEAVQKIKPLEIDIICPGHGPILRMMPWDVVELFAQWAKEALHVHPEGKVFIGYVSAYGYTERMAQTIKEELEKYKLSVTMLNVSESDPELIYDAIRNSKALLIGSPTINQDTLLPIWETLAMVSPITDRGKVAGAFGSYGWSGEAVGIVTDRLKGMKLNVLDGVRIKFIPSNEQFEELRAFARRVVEALG